MAIISKVYINNIYQGSTSGTTWPLSKIYTTPAPMGQGYYLPMPYLEGFTWYIDTYDTVTEMTTGSDTWTFVTKPVPRGSSIPQRDDDYNPDLVWVYNPETAEYEWMDIMVSGGGRYGMKILVIGNSCLYYS